MKKTLLKTKVEEKKTTIPPWRRNRPDRELEKSKDEVEDMFSLFAYEEDKKMLSLDPQDEDEWQRVNVGIDSCAATSCINKDLLPAWP